MRKLTPLLFTCCLMAADFWQSKPFTEWSDKEVHRILTNSPWVHEVSIEMGSPAAAAPDNGGRAGAGGSGTRPPGMDPAVGPAIMVPIDPAATEADRAKRAADSVGQMSGEGRSLQLTVRWQSALPVKQAQVRLRFGAEGVASVDAKKLLEDGMNYLIAVSGLTPSLMRAPQAKSDILQRTTLSAKGKDPVHASDILVSPSGKVTEAIFVFPKTTPLDLDDKDVEFSTQFGTFPVKSKFRLKDMVVNGALQL
jgi:hypothetical protein